MKHACVECIFLRSRVTPAGTNSIDQVVAAQIGKATRFTSLQLGWGHESIDGGSGADRISVSNAARVAPVTDAKIDQEGERSVRAPRTCPESRSPAPYGPATSSP